MVNYLKHVQLGSNRKEKIDFDCPRKYLPHSNRCGLSFCALYTLQWFQSVCVFERRGSKWACTCGCTSQLGQPTVARCPVDSEDAPEHRNSAVLSASWMFTFYRAHTTETLWIWFDCTNMQKCLKMPSNEVPKSLKLRTWLQRQSTAAAKRLPTSTSSTAASRANGRRLGKSWQRSATRQATSGRFLLQKYAGDTDSSADQLRSKFFGPCPATS